jgi:hypothetical protein
MNHPTSEDICGEFAASFIPREQIWFVCVLPKGHEGDPNSHRAGGTCKAHGPYVMEKFGQVPNCPQWPKCIEDLMSKEK